MPNSQCLQQSLSRCTRCGRNNSPRFWSGVPHPGECPPDAVPCGPATRDSPVALKQILFVFFKARAETEDNSSGHAKVVLVGSGKEEIHKVGCFMPGEQIIGSAGQCAMLTQNQFHAAAQQRSK